MARVSLPTKTKIAAWIMIVIGGIGIIGGLLTAIRGFVLLESGFGYLGLGMIVFASGSLYYVPGLLLFARNRIAWISSAGILFVEMAFSLAMTCDLVGALIRGGLPYLFAASVLCLIIHFLFSPFMLILLLLDRKNYWEITRR